ncbi:uracil-DNA glycosylase [Lentibacter algarum]|uniref:uracil-DNA glycosylase n=1 Tax=Lentibacter algarum TaxID=576131 RepID=UPI001C07C56E|nr:uracil-DNA glycosylase [Lentibacter algarum]MBU2981887.1 uracil-DNA glycosylase [Lentibacter algarum]
MESAQEYHAWRAALDWQIELGADEALSETPIDRFELVDMVKAKVPKVAEPVAVTTPVELPKVDVIAAATAAAEGASNLEELQAALAGFEHCELKKGARNLVFSGGVASARVMIIGDAPSRDDDQAGKPFSGAQGKLLDKMLAAIGLTRDESVYLTNVLPWRPMSQEPKPQDIAMMRPFVERHVALAAPEVVVLMGNISCETTLMKRGITRLRGTWAEVYGRPAMPMFAPEQLIRQPQLKRDAWADLLELKARLM